MTALDPTIEVRKERAWREVAAIDAAYERGEIDDAGWHAAMQTMIVPAYLAAQTPYAQAGHGGDAVSWEYGRRPITEAMDRDGTFLDIGCANGILMETAYCWCAEKGIAIEPYGLDLSPDLANLARRRLTHWADRICVGNALTWTPPFRFDFVRTCIDCYVPNPRRPELVRHLLEDVVAPGGRLIIGMFVEEVERRTIEESVASWGFAVAGQLDVPHQSDSRLVRRVFWLDSR